MISLSYSSRAYTHKPQGAEIALQQREIDPITIDSNEPERFLFNAIGRQGHAYRDTVLVDGCRTENFVEQHLLTLDFDSGITVDEVLVRCEKLKLIPAVIYNTFSNTDKQPRFRVIFILDEAITNANVAKALRRCINYLFPEADPIKSIVQLYQGSTKGGIGYIKGARVNAGWIFLLAVAFLKRDTLQNHYRRDLKSKLLLADTPKVYTKKMASPNIYIERATFLVEISVAVSNDVIDDEKSKRHFDWKAQLEGCRFTKECFEGAHWATELEFYYLCMLYKNCKGGQKRLKQVADDLASKHAYTAQQRQNLLNTLKNAGSSPIRCSTIDCPYQSECKKTTPLQAQPLGIGECYSTAANAPQTLTAADKQLETYIKEAFACVENTAILKAPCGIGKSAKLIEYISKRKEQRFLYAVPTHELAREIAQRFAAAGVDAALVPELCLDDLEPELREQYKQRLNIGDSTGARAILFQSKNENVVNYWLMTDRFKGDLLQNRVVICTHSRALTKANLCKYDAVIFDEDIFLNSIETIETNASEVSSFAPGDFAEKMQNCGEGLQDIKPLSSKVIAEFCKSLSSKCPFDMAAVLSAGVLLKDGEKLIFGVKHELPKTNKTLVASATCDDSIARWLLNTDNVKTLKIDSVEMVGKLYQHLTQASRKRLQSDTKEQFKSFTQIAGSENIISFKSFENHVVMQAHFGAVAGLDSMKGQDLVIIGTPRNNPAADLIFARFCDRTIRADDADSMQMQNCAYNDWKFKFFAAVHPVLRQVQLYSVNSQLTQAAGRGRILRENCRCFVFSELPLESAEMI